MKKYAMIIVILGLFGLPACAQENLTFGHEPPPLETSEILDNQSNIIITNPVPPCTPPVSLIGQNALVMQTMRFPHPVRIIKPGDAVTMDHSPERVNFILDDRGIIQSITCG